MICDSCSMVTYDYGVDSSIMIEVGLDVEDHLCDSREENLTNCKCACNYVK